MSIKHGTAPQLSPFRAARPAIRLRVLVGSGDRITLFTLPVLAVGLVLNAVRPSWFSIGGPPAAVRVVALVLLIPGVAMWLWSVALILVNVPQGRLITNGPYALVKHPIYTAVALLVLPAAGCLLNSWLGAVVGITLYAGSRMFAPAEEAALSKAFGSAWEDYCGKVKLPWL